MTGHLQSIVSIKFSLTILQQNILAIRLGHAIVPAGKRVFDRVGIVRDTALCQRLDHSRRGTHLGQAASARLPLAIVIVAARVNLVAKTSDIANGSDLIAGR